MKYLICYDISDDKCRRKVVKYLESLAYRIQYSVFRADCTREQLNKIKNRLVSLSEGYDDVIITIIRKRRKTPGFRYGDIRCVHLICVSN